jgi:glc operon protein GlcG
MIDFISATVSYVIQQSVIEYDEARRMLDALIAEITRRGKAGVIAVTDPHGELIALARMDGAPYSSITIAIHKAYTAARERKPSKDIGIASRHPEKGFDIGYFGDPKITGWGGGVPIVRNGSVVGAVAISGLPQAEDMELADFAAGLAAG